MGSVLGSTSQTNVPVYNMHLLTFGIPQVEEKSAQVLFNLSPINNDDKKCVTLYPCPVQDQIFEVLIKNIGKQDVAVVTRIGITAIHNPYPLELKLIISRLVKTQNGHSLEIKIPASSNSTSQPTEIFIHPFGDSVRKFIGVTETYLENKIQKDPNDDQFELISNQSWLYEFARANLPILNLNESDLAAKRVVSSGSSGTKDINMVSIKSSHLEAARRTLKTKILSEIVYIKPEDVNLSVMGDSATMAQLYDQVKITKQKNGQSHNIAICLKVDYIVRRMMGPPDVDSMNFPL